MAAFRWALRNSPRGAPGRPAELSIASPSLRALLRPGPRLCPRLLGRAPGRAPSSPLRSASPPGASPLACSRCPSAGCPATGERERQGAAGVWVWVLGPALPPLCDSGFGDTLCPLAARGGRSRVPSPPLPSRPGGDAPAAALAFSAGKHSQGFPRALPRGEDALQSSPRAPLAGATRGRGSARSGSHTGDAPGPARSSTRGRLPSGQCGKTRAPPLRPGRARGDHFANESPECFTPTTQSFCAVSGEIWQTCGAAAACLCCCPSGRSRRV